jgi:hypothetical protein
MKKAFDLGSLDTIEACNKAAEVEIKHPVNGSSTGVFISVLGRDSDTYRGIVRNLANETLAKRAQGKAIDTNMDKMDDKNIEALVAVTTGWRTGDEPVVVVKGEKLDYSAANARKLYSGLLFVRDQVQEAVDNLENFMPA